MPVAKLYFSGNFVCRLATNPDPYDEPRGRLGWTRAYPGEPDLDRHIRFQWTKAETRFGSYPQPVSVFQTSPGFQQLQGLPIDLLGHNGHMPAFEGRDGIVAPPGKEPIVPLILRLGNDGLAHLVFCDSLQSHWVETVAYSDDYSAISDPVLVGKAKERHFAWAVSIANRVSELENALLQVKNRAAEQIVESRLRQCKELAVGQGVEKKYSEVRRYQSISCKSLSTRWSKDALLRYQIPEPEVMSKCMWVLDLFFFGFDKDALCGICVGSLTTV